MTREQLEKDFDEKFCIPESYERFKDDIYPEEIKNHIFNELIPEVFREILNENVRAVDLVEIKQKAKEFGFII